MGMGLSFLNTPFCNYLRMKQLKPKYLHSTPLVTWRGTGLLRKLTNIRLKMLQIVLLR